MPKDNQSYEFKAILCPHLEGADPDEAWANPMSETIRIEDTLTHATELVLCPVCYGVITGHVLRDVFSSSVKEVAEKVARETLSNVTSGIHNLHRGG